MPFAPISYIKMELDDILKTEHKGEVEIWFDTGKKNIPNICKKMVRLAADKYKNIVGKNILKLNTDLFGAYAFATDDKNTFTMICYQITILPCNPAKHYPPSATFKIQAKGKSAAICVNSLADFFRDYKTDGK